MMQDKKILVNVSNHPSRDWSEEQKEGFDVIIDIPFPEIDPDWDTNDRGYARALEGVRRELAAIWNTYTPDNKVCVFIGGELSATYHLIRWANWYGFVVLVPTTKRVVEEEVKEDGSVEKKSIFRFVRWRTIL